MRLTAVSVLGFAALAACADNPVAPEHEVIVPFAIDAVQRMTLASLLHSATRDESLRTLTYLDARARVVAAFERLSERVAQNDRGGAHGAIRGAREALRAYTERAPSDVGAGLELAALTLALDHAEALAGDSPEVLYDIRRAAQ
jgi:hypothetical protein